MIREDRVCLLDNLSLANGVRLHHCQTRRQYWLLFSEGALRLDHTAVAVVSLCDGDRSFEAISQTLSSLFCDVEVERVRDLLLQMMQRGLLVNKAR